jgi:excisionase family DNA binding protein
MDKGTSYLSIRQTATRLSVHPSSVRRWIVAGALKAVYAGPHLVRIPESEIERFVRPFRKQRSLTAHTEAMSGDDEA